MRIKPRLAINLTTVLILAIVMVGWVVTQIVGTGVFESPFTVTADFASSGGVFTNQEVTYRGVLVGQVGDLELNEDGVDIELQIEPDWEEDIPEGVIATVQSKSAVGEQFVNLTPFIDTGPMLDDGDAIPRAQTRLPVDFQALLRSLDRVLADVPVDRTRRLIANLAGGIGGRGEEIATILESLGTLADAFASVAPEQRRLLVNATTTGREFLRTKDAFADAIRAADEVFAGIGDEPEELAALFSANDAFAREGIAFLAVRSDELARGIGSLADFVEFQLEERAQVERSLTYVPQLLHAIEDASIPWRSEDGREFYRIRVGQVLEDVPASWPCKYRVAEDYERLPHERDERKPNTSTNCLDEGERAADTQLLAESLVDALETWAAANPEDVAPDEPPVYEGPLDEKGLIWPLAGPVTSYFGMRDGRMHAGIDIGGQTGDPVAAAAAGTVVFSGHFSGYGTTVIVDHDDGTQTLYGHLAYQTVVEGQDVDQGDVIGVVGCTGNCTGEHLHFEVHRDFVPVDPLDFLPGGLLFTE